MSPISFDLDYLEYWGRFLCVCIVVPLAIIGTVILLRKDRSLPCLVFTIGAVVALLSEFFGQLIYIWITEGWLWLFMGERNESWGLHVTTQAATILLQTFSALAAGCGFVVFAARRSSSNLEAQSPDREQMEPASKLWSFPIVSAAIIAVIFVAATAYYHVAHSHQEQRAHEQAIGLLSCKTDDLDIHTFEAHFSEHYGDITISTRQGARDLPKEVSAILQENPGAKLFHYDTPEIVWQNLGGRRGYAIIYEAKVVWELKIGQS